MQLGMGARKKGREEKNKQKEGIRSKRRKRAGMET